MKINKLNLQSYHPLLQYQLKKSTSDNSEVNYEKFISGINNAYREFEHNINMLERSISLMSEEMLEQYEELEKHKNSLEVIIEQRTRQLSEAKYEAENANKLKSGFLTNMSHELRTPMHAIIGFTELGIKNAASFSVDEHIENLQEILDSAQGLLLLLNSLLDLTKLESGKVIYDMKEASVLANCVNAVCKELQPLLDQKQLNISFNSEANNMKSEFDVPRISQVLRNLISNSIKFSESGKTIKITINNYKLKTDDILDILKPITEEIKSTLKSINNLRSIAEFIQYVKIKGSMLSSTSRNMVLRIKKDFEVVIHNSHLYNYIHFIDLRNTNDAANIIYNKNLKENKKEVDPQMIQNILHTLNSSNDNTLLTLVPAKHGKTKEFSVKALTLVHNFDKTEVIGIIELGASLPYSFGDYLICQVIDQGPGIPQNELISVFDKFVQSTKTNLGAGGTGLGLAICREIIVAHNGRIWAENNPEGGAKFSFIIPLTQLKPMEEL